MCNVTDHSFLDFQWKLIDSLVLTQYLPQLCSLTLICRHVANPNVARALARVRGFHSVVKSNGGSTVALSQLAAGNPATIQVATPPPPPTLNLPSPSPGQPLAASGPTAHTKQQHSDPGGTTVRADGSGTPVISRSARAMWEKVSTAAAECAHELPTSPCM